MAISRFYERADSGGLKGYTAFMLEDLRQKIENRAKAAGFDAVGFSTIHLPEKEGAALRQMVAENRHGAMHWMAERVSQRQSPDGLWPDVRSVICLAMNYGPARDPMSKLARRDRANISVYAQNRDYHDLVKKRLKEIARWLVAETGCTLKVFVDTAPVMEKALAARTTIGWQGKHSNIVSREFGSWLFLGEIYTSLPLPEENRIEDHCGNCRACLDICPTDAIIAPYKLDARRCISYLTIEHPGHIARAYRSAIGNRIYGCDDCLAICPWNKFARPTDKQAFQSREGLDGAPLVSFLSLDDAEFRKRFSKSPIKRIKRERFLRNILIALGNSEDRSPETRAAIKLLLKDPAPVIRAMAVWSLSQLMDGEEFSKLADSHLDSEKDPDVQNEWQFSIVPC